MVMTYGDIDKSKERRNDLDIIVTNLTKVLDETDWSWNKRDDLEKLVKEAFNSALKLKGDS